LRIENLILTLDPRSSIRNPQSLSGCLLRSNEIEDVKKEDGKIEMQGPWIEDSIRGLFTLKLAGLVGVITI
jgi:hypothetical protein